MSIKRYVDTWTGMIPADDGEWVMWSELEPLVQRAVDAAKANGILAGSIVAEEHDEELRCAKAHIALLEEEAMTLKKRLHDMALELVAAESRLIARVKGEWK